MSKNSRNRKRAEAPVAETKIERLEKILGTDQDLPNTGEVQTPGGDAPDAFEAPLSDLEDDAVVAPVANDETPTAEDEAEQAAIEERAEEEAEIEATPVVSEPVSPSTTASSLHANVSERSSETVSGGAR